MIVKILSNAGGFAGIHYNKRKNDQGSSELLLAENFDALGHSENEVSKIDYVNYLKMVSSLNPRVDKKQFHAIISTKGRTHSPEELKDIAVAYLEKMGYGENPYLIYSHSDTANNHVHLVTSRVNKQGKKIDDSYERVRSQKAIQEILEQNPKEQLKTILKRVFQYQYTTTAQFKLLLEQQGYRILEKGDTLKIIKHGIKQGTIAKESVMQEIESHKSIAWKARERQLQAIFDKYKPGMDTDKFMQFAKQKFGIDIVLHQQKGHDAPYGYTVVDHKEKYVFKGSQVMSLKTLMENIPFEEKIKHLVLIIKTIAENETLGFRSLNKEVQSLGFQMNHQGQIFKVGQEGEVLVSAIDNELLRESKYRDRVQEAGSYHIANDRALQALAKLFFVNPDAIHPTLKEASLTKERQIIKDKLQAIAQAFTIGEGLKALDLEIVKHQEAYYVLDKKNKILLDYSDVSNDKLSIHQADVINLDRLPIYGHRLNSHHKVYESRLTHKPTDIFNIISMLSTYEEEDGSLETSQKNKRKR